MNDKMKKDFKVNVQINYFDSIINVRVSNLPATEKALNDIAKIIENYVNEKIGLYLTLIKMGVIK